MYDLPYRLWTKKRIGVVVCRFGIPIEIDELTYGKNLMNFVRVLVKVDLTKELPKTLTFKQPKGTFEVRLEYENLPVLCNNCLKTGHMEQDCPPPGTAPIRSYAAAAAGREGRARGTSRPRTQRRRQATINVATRQEPAVQVQETENHAETVSTNEASLAQQQNGVQEGANVEDVELQQPAENPIDPRPEVVTTDRETAIPEGEQRGSGLPPRPNNFRRRSRSRSVTRAPQQRIRGMFITDQGVPIPSTDDDGNGDFELPRRTARRVLNAWRSFGQKQVSSGEGSINGGGPSVPTSPT